MGGIRIGQTLARQYRVDAFVASGGMAAVYRVWDPKRNVPLAMKVLHADLADDPSIFKRFKREARALERLAHPNIVPFYGLFQSADFAFLLERFIDGPSLKDILRHRKAEPLPVEEALVYLKAVSSALGYAHAHGVVHCDVKPGNVMVDRGGSVYLTDFGVARHAESTTTTLGFAGTAGYMAPEQVRGEPVSPATDVYALGAMLYEMLTGERPFRGDEQETEGKGSTGAERVRWAHLHLAPPDPRVKNPSLPEGMAQAVLKALEKEPGARWRSIREFYEAACTALGQFPDRVADRVEDIQWAARPFTLAIESESIALGQEPFLGRVTRRIRHSLPWLRERPYRAPAMALVIVLAIVGAWAILKGSLDTAGSQGRSTADDMANVTRLTPAAQPAVITRPSSTPTPRPSATPIPTASITPPEIRINPADSAELVFVQAGKFLMGSDPETDPYFWGAESPQHEIYLDDYWIYRSEVTNLMYRKCTEVEACPRPALNSSRTRSAYFGDQAYDNYPVIFVSWVGASAYCRWAGGRLPTEAEWEKAARGDDGRLFPWGNEPPSGDKANFCDRNCAADDRVPSQDDGYQDTAPVGNYGAGTSPYGALDMAGNVWEWTFDWFQELYYKLSPDANPRGPESGTRRVIRGGSWFNPTSGIRTVGRASVRPDDTLDTLGFRCVMDAP